MYPSIKKMTTVGPRVMKAPKADVFLVTAETTSGDDMQHCDSKCGQCSRNWWKWFKARQAQMSVPRKAKLYPEAKNGRVYWVLRSAESISFNECAETSVKAPRPLEDCPVRFNVGDKVLWRGEEFVVLFDGGYVGLDGRHRVQVKRGDWKVHLYCWELILV